MSITKELLTLGFSSIALGLSIYNFIRSLIDTRMKYQLDYNEQRFAIDNDLAAFETQVFRKEGEAQQLRRDGKHAGVQEVVDVADKIEKDFLKVEFVAIEEIKSSLKMIPQLYAGRKFIVPLDTIRNRLKKSHSESEWYHAKIDNLILAARHLLSRRSSTEQSVQH